MFFMDFDKASDEMSHIKLINKWTLTSISSLMYYNMKDMYRNQKNNLQVKISNNLFNNFLQNKDTTMWLFKVNVLQFYKNDINTFFMLGNDTPRLRNKNKYLFVLYANDLILLSSSKKAYKTPCFCTNLNMEKNMKVKLR